MGQYADCFVFSGEIHLSWPLVGAGASRSSIKKQAPSREHCKSQAFEKFNFFVES